MFPKTTRYENEKLRRLARDRPCMIQLDGICNRDTATSVWCHSNASEHGKGAHRKADDCFGAIGCSACHHAIDQGSKLSRDERRDAMRRAMDRTLLYLWREGLIQVTP